MRKIARTICFFIILTLLMTIFTVVLAGDGVDSEPNNSYSQAEAITFRGTNGENYVANAVGKIGYNGDEDWYSITIPAGQYSITLTNNTTSSTSNIFGSLPADFDIFIYISTNLSTPVAYSSAYGTTSEHCTLSVASSALYYIRVDGFLSAYSSTVQYKMFMTKGDTEMLLDGFRYKLFPMPFYGRCSSGTEYHSSVVAYSHGIKDTRSMYTTKMNEANSYKTTPQDNWNDYSSSHPRPGRYQDELPSSDSSWAGIDCSGFIYRTAEASSIDYYSVAHRTAYTCGTGEFLLATDSTTTTLANLRIGDVVQKPNLGHIMMISRLATTFSNLYVLHADGKTTSRTIFEEAINSARSGLSTSNLYKLDLN